MTSWDMSGVVAWAAAAGNGWRLSPLGLPGEGGARGGARAIPRPKLRKLVPPLVRPSPSQRLRANLPAALARRTCPRICRSHFPAALAGGERPPQHGAVPLAVVHM